VNDEEVMDGGRLAFLGVLPSIDEVRDSVAAKLKDELKRE
jgi:hypothetical protein